MKPTPITSLPGIWRGLCDLTTAVVVWLLLSMAGVTEAQVTNVIYQDNFGRTGMLNNTMPSPTDNYNATGGYTSSGGNAVWWANTNLAPMLTDGSEIAYTNASPTGAFFINGFLPFTPQAGHIYTLSVSILGLTGGNNWLAAGYSQGEITNNYFAIGSPLNAVGWLLQRATDTQVQTFLGPSTATEVTYNFASNGLFNAWSMVLDTTKGNGTSGWVVTWLLNGVQERTATFTANPTIHYVGLGGDGATGYYQNFSLTDYQPPSSAPVISEAPNNVTAQVGQTATFWVNASGVPTPTYQWMTNSAGGVTNAITGATNAVYTTPALSSAYNGLNYQVKLVNYSGSTNSVPATLTVVAGAPTVFSAAKTGSGTSVVILFSKGVSAATALNAANYSLNDGATILSASYFSSLSNSILLTTSTLNPNAAYLLTVQNVQDFFGDVATNTTVPVLPAGLALYLRADSGVLLDNNGLVDEWLDQSTNGNNVVQYFNGPSTRPSPGSINSAAAVSFNGASSNYLTAASSPSLSITSNMTIYAVVNFASLAATNEILSKAVGNLPAPYDYYENAGGGAMDFNWGNGSADGAVLSSPSVSAVPSVLAMMLVATNKEVAFVTNFLNGVTNGSGSITLVQSISDAGQQFYLGGRQDQAQFMNGQMAEVMVFGAALSAGDMTSVDNYLGAKYFTFAIVTNLPASVTSSNGYSVSYSISANQGSTHITYQWQENGTNIPGATASAYTTPLLAPSDNGDTFDVVMTLPNGSTYTSTISDLTVITRLPVVTLAGMPIWNTNSILVFFSEPLDPATATVAANYSLNNGASVSSATFGSASNEVVLTTSPLNWNGNPGYYTLTIQNVKDVYGNVIAPASPSVGIYPPTTVLWVKADVDVTTDAGTNTVNQWGDLSGNGNTLMGENGLGFSEPLLETNALGDPVVYFAGTNSYAGTALLANDAPSLEITGDMSVIAVATFDTTNFSSAQGEIVSKTGGSGVNGNIPAPYDYYAASTGVVLYRGNGSSAGDFGDTNGPSVGTPHILAVSETGNTVTHYLDGQFAASGVLSGGFNETNSADQGQPVFVGGRSDIKNHRFLVGDIAELIVLSSAISTNDLASLNAYLIAEHKLSIVTSTPVNPNPTNIVTSVTGNHQITFSWPADHIGWQLQSNSIGLTATGAWFNVAGSTTTNQVTITPNTSTTNVFFRLMYP